MCLVNRRIGAVVWESTYRVRSDLARVPEGQVFPRRSVAVSDVGSDGDEQWLCVFQSMG